MERKQKKNIEFRAKTESSLLEFLMKALDGISRNSAKSLLTHRMVRINSRLETKHDFVVKPGMTVEVSRGRGQNELKNKQLKMLYEDPYIVVVEKAAGLLTVATAREKEKTAHEILKEYARRTYHGRIFVVHRLDRDTSGILIFAKDEKTMSKLRENWNDIVKVRGYIAIVSGEMERNKGTVTSWLTENEKHEVYSSPVAGIGDWAVTNYRTLERKGGYSLVNVDIETGRRNQIRVHMKEMGHPIVGDEKYGNGDNPIKRLGLHAYRLVFNHPATGKLMTFELPYPDEFKRIFNSNQ